MPEIKYSAVIKCKTQGAIVAGDFLYVAQDGKAYSVAAAHSIDEKRHSIGVALRDAKAGETIDVRLYPSALKVDCMHTRMFMINLSIAMSTIDVTCSNCSLFVKNVSIKDPELERLVLKQDMNKFIHEKIRRVALVTAAMQS